MTVPDPRETPAGHAPPAPVPVNSASGEARLFQALAFAADKHRDQRRKGREASPYINHPIAVAGILAAHGITDTTTLQAAVLHDTLEDTETTPRELARTFGAAVRDLVLEVTDEKALPRGERKERQVRGAPDLSDPAKLIRIADKIANVRDVTHRPPDWPLERRLEYLDWTERVVAGCRGVNSTLDALYDHALTEGRRTLSR